MKWHKNLYDAVIQIYNNVIESGRGADEFFYTFFRRNPQWGKRDRNFIKEHVFQLLRYKNLWEELAYSLFGKADVNNLVKAYILHLPGELPTFMDKEKELKIVAQKLLESLQKNPHLATGFPAWLFQKGMDSWGVHWQAIARRLNHASKPVIRVNTLKIKRADLAKDFIRQGYDFKILSEFPDAIIFNKSYRLQSSSWFRQGLFEWQDLSSQAVGYFTEVKPGMTVVDACAGAGGKTLQLAALMRNTGKIYAFDISHIKLEELKKRARRAGVKNLREIGIVTPERIKKLHNKADVVLIDAPCSGSGTYQRKPHLKWKFTPQDFNKIIENQRHILNEYAPMVKPGGYLIYVTCSILDEENKIQILDFLNRNKDYIFVEEKHILPAPGRDGFYMAKMQKK